MPDITIGDRVRWLKSDLSFDIEIGHEGTVTRVKNGDFDFTVMPDGMTGVDWYGYPGRNVQRATIELVTPVYAPGTRIRGTFEGIVDSDGLSVTNPHRPSAVYLDDLTDITVIKTLPSAPGSVITFTSVNEDFVLFDDGYWRQLTNHFHHVNGDYFNDNWTLRFDAGDK